MADTNVASKKSFKDLLAEYTINIPQVGDSVECEVLAVDKGSVRLDIHGVTVGVVRGQELFTESKEYSNLNPGDKVFATVIGCSSHTNQPAPSGFGKTTVLYACRTQ